MKLVNKVVVVTGSGNGIGAAFARRFTAEGAKVVVTDVDGECATRVAAEIGSVALACDITVEENVKAVADLARSTYGQIDVWFSNAGYAGPQQPGVVQDNAMWDKLWNLHVMSHVYASREVLPEMLARGDGYLLATSSVTGMTIQGEKVAYSVTKHAALAFSEWLAVSYGDKGIKVSCFCPGAMLTNILRANVFPEGSTILDDALTPEQVADVVTKGIDAERFLIAELTMGPDALAAKARDYDAWITSARAAYLGR